MKKYKKVDIEKVIIPLTIERVKQFYEENDVVYSTSIHSKGLYAPDLNKVYINPIFGSEEEIKTVIHEILHWHYDDWNMGDLMTEDEIEAEMEEYIGTEIEDIVRSFQYDTTYENEIDL